MKPLRQKHGTRPRRAGAIFSLVVAALLSSGVALGGAPKPLPSATVSAPPPARPGMVLVGPGVLKLLDPPTVTQTDEKVARFYLDKVPVTNEQYLAFVKAHREWQRGLVPKILADGHYLEHWENPLTLGANALPDGPVVRVSWFGAKAYCQARGVRLPTEAEWELAARASETQASPATDPKREQEILAWYGQATPTRIGPVMKGKPNFWGVHDLHGLVWEWVGDFNNRVVSDGRRTDEAFVCGGGTLTGADKTRYASFMRMAFRASLRGSYTTPNLGFRCAADVGP